MGWNGYNALDLKVNNYIFEGRDWDVNAVNQLFSVDIAFDIFNTPMPSSAVLNDKPSWMGSDSGKFTVSTYYSFILRNNSIKKTNDWEWNWLWKLKLPMRVIMFIWFVRQGKFLTN